ncbi:hypothetical protein Tco_0338175, partial [Tanacetum coccineum]
MTEITHQETPEDGDRPRVLGFTEKETYGNSGPENRKLIDAEAEAVHMILLGQITNDDQVSFLLLEMFVSADSIKSFLLIVQV